MPIVYALVARGSTVLAEYSPETGNFTQIARQLLAEVTKRNSGPDRRSYAAGNNVFHYIVAENNLVVLCMADREAGSRVPFAFLQDIQQKFLAQFARSFPSAGENSLDDAFARVLDQQMQYFNYSPEADEFRKIKNDLHEVMDVMVQNIDKVLERGEKIEVLVTQTETLQASSYRMRNASSKLKKRLWWKNVYLWMCICALCVIILAIVVGIVLIVAWRSGLFSSSDSSKRSIDYAPAPAPGTAVLRYPDVTSTSELSLTSFLTELLLRGLEH